jgi:hypothetical protein
VRKHVPRASVAVPVCTISVVPATALAQVHPPPPVPVQPAPVQGDTATRTDYRFEGAIVGGVATGVPTAVPVAGVCDSLRGSTFACVLQATAGLVVGAIRGLTIGGLIGRSVDKPSSQTEEVAWVDSGRVPVGPRPRRVKMILLRIPIGSP